MDVADCVGDTPQARDFLKREKNAVEGLLHRLKQPGYVPTNPERLYLASGAYGYLPRRVRANDYLRGHGLRVNLESGRQGEMKIAVAIEQWDLCLGKCVSCVCLMWAEREGTTDREEEMY